MPGTGGGHGVHKVEVEQEGKAGVGRGGMGYPQALVSGPDVRRGLRPCPG